MPLAVKFVVLAPPFMENNPAVIVDDALEMKPLVKVASPVCDSVPAIAADCAERTPIDAEAEYKFVLLAVVEKKLVVVPEVSESVPRVERPVTASGPKFAV